MTTPVYGAHEAKTYYVEESTYGVTPTNPSMLGIATAESVEPALNPGLIKVRGTGSRDLQAIRKGVRQVELKIAYNLPSDAPINFLQHAQTLNSLSLEVIYEKSTGIIDLLHKGCRFDSLTVECSVEGLLKAVAELIGQDVAVGTSKISGATYSDYSGAVPYYESYVKKGGTTLERVTDFSFTTENNLKRVPVILQRRNNLRLRKQRRIRRHHQRHRVFPRVWTGRNQQGGLRQLQVGKRFAANTNRRPSLCKGTFCCQNCGNKLAEGDGDENRNRRN